MIRWPGKGISWPDKPLHDLGNNEVVGRGAGVVRVIHIILTGQPASRRSRLARNLAVPSWLRYKIKLSFFSDFFFRYSRETK